MEKTYLGLNIKKLRKSKGFSQTEFSEKINIQKATISAYENGYSNPSFDVLIKIRNLFKVNLDDLIFKDLSQEEVIIDNLNEPISAYGKLMQNEIIDLQKKRINQLEQVILRELPDKAEELQITDKNV